MIFLSLPSGIYAQEYTAPDISFSSNGLTENYNTTFSPWGRPEGAFSFCQDSVVHDKKTSWIQNAVNVFNNAYRHNPEYLKNEKNQLKVRLLGTINLPSILIHPRRDLERRLIFSSDPLKYVGADIGWNIFAIGYSVGLDRKNSMNNGRFSFNTYTRFFAINYEILWVNNLSISNIESFISEEEKNGFEDEIPGKIAIDGAFFRSRSLQFMFFPNGKKMAYGNTINPVFRQIKSAGTFVMSLGYADYDFNTNLENSDMDKYPWISEVALSNINLSKYELGAGYSYNSVISRRWILFISDIVGVSAKHYTYEMLYDNSPVSNTKVGICNYLRTGACYYNNDYFIGTNISYEFDALNATQFLFNKTNLNAVVYLGYKFNVDGFNRFVSKMLKVEIK